jgi:DNA-binding LacI/PurR family transcriptional regulator
MAFVAMTLKIQKPFPPRKASSSLRDQIIAYLRAQSPRVGAPFYTEAQLTAMTGLSRNAVRKALGELQSQGWLDRSAGRGSFVGPRAGSLSPADVVVPTTAARATPPGRKVVRLAVLAFGMAGSMPDWYSRGVLEGIDAEAIDEGIAIELLSDRSNEVALFARRLQQSRPDVLAVLPATIRHTLAVFEAQRLGIPCLVTGTRLIDLNLPTVYEDNHQGAAAAVKHLAGQGHARIGLLSRPDTAAYVFQRRQGYAQGLLDAGLPADERLVHWTSSVGEDEGERILAYVAREKPTALLVNSTALNPVIGPLMRSGRLRVPADVSVVCFDQAIADHHLHLGLRPTTVALPLVEMGRTLARLARRIVEGETVETQTPLPCTLVEGDTVRAITA